MDFIKPEVGKRYVLNGEVVEVVNALKRRYWRIVVAYPNGRPGIYAIKQREWASATVAQP